MKLLALIHTAFLLGAADSKFSAATLHVLPVMAAGLLRHALIARRPFMGWSRVFAS